VSPPTIPSSAIPPADLVARYSVHACDDVFYVPDFFDADQRLYDELESAIPWREETIGLFGRRVTVPRLTAWNGDDGVGYRYSRGDHRANGWLNELAGLRDHLRSRLGIRFNFVLANLYRHGQDAMGWHADDEPELGECPCIASLSLGAARRFCLRARDGSRRRTELLLESGSLLFMWGRSQHDWLHAVPRTRRPVGPRINLTFRQVETTP